MVKKILKMLLNLVCLFLFVATFDLFNYVFNYNKLNIIDLEIKNEINNFMYVREELIIYLNNNDYLFTFNKEENLFIYDISCDYKPLLNFYKTKTITLSSVVDLSNK